MYIEMTTFSIPSIIIDGLIFAACAIGAWCLVSVIVLTIYHFGGK
jgi:hypothetical protein